MIIHIFKMNLPLLLQNFQLISVQSDFMSRFVFSTNVLWNSLPSWIIARLCLEAECWLRLADSTSSSLAPLHMKKSHPQLGGWCQCGTYSVPAHTETAFTKNLCAPRPGLRNGTLGPPPLLPVSMIRWKWDFCWRLPCHNLKIKLLCVSSHPPLDSLEQLSLFTSLLFVSLYKNHMHWNYIHLLSKFHPRCMISQIPGVMFFVTSPPLFLLFHYPSTLTWPFQRGSLAGMTDEKAHSFPTVTAILENTELMKEWWYLITFQRVAPASEPAFFAACTPNGRPTDVLPLTCSAVTVVIPLIAPFAREEIGISCVVEQIQSS